MRALKTLLIILLAVVALAIVLGLMGPARSEVSRAVVVQAPADVVYAHANSLQRMAEWSPWNKKDPGIKLTYSGPDGVVGQSSTWAGNSDVGSGAQEIITLEAAKKVAVAVHFKEPFSGEAVADLDLVPMADSTKATWTYRSENNFVARIFLALNDMDKMLGPDLQEGLNELKAQSEADARTAEITAKERTFQGFTITAVDRPEATYVGQRSEVKWVDLDTFLPTTFGGTAKAAGKAGVPIAGAATGLYYAWDEAGQKTDLFAGFPVQAASTTVPGCTNVTIPGGKAWTIAYRGNPSGTEAAHKAMDGMLKEQGIEMRLPVVEEYHFNPEQDKDTSTWLTEIYYYVK